MQLVAKIKKRLIKAAKVVALPIINFVTSKTKIDDNLIILVSFFGRNVGDNPGAIYSQLKDSGYDFVFLVKNPKNYEEYPCVRLYSLKSYILLRKAKLIISNSRMTPKWKKRDGQVYLQTWHGTPLKRLVHDLEVFNMPSASGIEAYHKLFDDEVKRWDYLLSTCPFTTEKLTSAFQYNGKILEIGYPRNQKLYDYSNQDIIDIKKKIGLEQEDKIILYAPTYRDNQNKGVGQYFFDSPLDFKKIRSEFPEYKILIRYHYIITESNDFENENVINVSQYNDIADLYLISDILITDYSSVFFDYSVLKKPFLFFTYDIEEYKNELRGFYLDLYKDFPVKPVKSTDELIDQIRNINTFDYKSFADEYNPEKNKDCYLEIKNIIDNIMKS